MWAIIDQVEKGPKKAIYVLSLRELSIIGHFTALWETQSISEMRPIDFQFFSDAQGNWSRLDALRKHKMQRVLFSIQRDATTKTKMQRVLFSIRAR